jgi:antitoxin component HigA of HigAB toxin-antitoxin module
MGHLFWVPCFIGGNQVARKKKRPGIIDIMQSKGLTMADVSRSTGVSISYVSRVFNGLREPRVTTAIKMAQYIGIPLEDFIAQCG